MLQVCPPIQHKEPRHSACWISFLGFLGLNLGGVLHEGSWRWLPVYTTACQGDQTRPINALGAVGLTSSSSSSISLVTESRLS